MTKPTLPSAEQIKSLLPSGQPVRWGVGCADHGLTVVWVQVATVRFPTPFPFNGINPVQQHNLAWFADAKAAKAWGRKMREEVA